MEKNNINREIYKKAEKIIISGYKEKISQDEIKASLVSLGIPFSSINPLYRCIVYDRRLVKNPVEITEEVCTELDTVELDFAETFETLQRLAEEISEKVGGASVVKVLRSIRSVFEEKGKSFPRKTSVVRGRIGNIGQTIINNFHENSEVTEKELLIELEKVTKNARKYLKANYKMLYALANNMSVKEVLYEFSKKGVL